MKIKLIPKTHKAKNRIREHGEFWRVQKEGTSISGYIEDVPGENDMFLISPESWAGQPIPPYMRWIKKKNDPHFDWVEVEDEELAAAIEKYKEKGKQLEGT